MLQKVRVFIQRHENGTYTVTVPGVRSIPAGDDWINLASHGLMLEEVKDDLRQALEKSLPQVDPALLHRYNNFKEGQYLEKVEVELRPSDPHGRRRHDKIRLKLSLLVTREERAGERVSGRAGEGTGRARRGEVAAGEEQYLVSVPKLMDPPLSFFCYALEELRETATRELAAYFSDYSLERLLDYEYQRQEFLDILEVSFTPLSPQKERKKEEEEDALFSWALRSAGVNLSARAAARKLSRAYRRDREVQEVLNVLAAERNASILLLGPSGAGKTAIVHEVVRRIAEENCPAALRKRQVWYTSANQLIAGCSYIGEWQEKLQNIVDEVKRRRHILHIDDIIGLLEAGRHSKGNENMAQFLKPFLADGTLLIVGETTPERYRVGENLDPGFLRLFRTLNVDEPNESTMHGIVGAVTGGLEREFKLRIEPSAQEAAIELTRRFQPYRAFPGKVVSFLEQVASDAAKTESEERVVLTRHSLVSAFARHSGLPEFILSDHLTLEPSSVERHFGERLIGQADAVQTVVDLITVIKAGLNDPQKPLGCFFFVGPTGVGKTEMAKTLAEYLFGSRDRLIRFDMSEYAEPLNVSKLIGSALGQEEGELTKRIRLQPFSVVLLDEFEKAHPSIFDVMLQVLGEGRLTDAGGRTADFRSAIILMTSNLGASPRAQRKPALRVDDSPRALGTHFRRQVEEFFRPEFVNRIDKIVVFHALDRAAMRQIAFRELARLLEREGVTRRSLLVEVDDDVIDLLLESGFSPLYGARPLKREIEHRIIVPLARYLVAHRITTPQLMRLTCDGEEITLTSTALTTAKQQVQRAPGPLSAPGAGDSQKLDLKALIEGFAALRLRLHQWAESDTIHEIRNEANTLLARTRERDFSSHGTEAHETWARIYHLERLTKRLDQLRDRAEYLEEFALLIQRERERRYRPDLSESYAELCRDLDYLEIELLTAHLRESGQALLRIRPLGRIAPASTQEPWVLTLVKMYLRWAKRKGYEFQVIVPTETYAAPESAPSPAGASGSGSSRSRKAEKPRKPPWEEVPLGDFAGLLKRLEALEVPEFALSVQGTNVYGFLKGEAGAHKLLSRPDDTEALAPFQTAAVRVEALEEEASARDHLIEQWEKQQAARSDDGKADAAPGLAADAAAAKGEPAKGKAGRKKQAEDVPEIVRLYMPEGDRYVRDLRTDVRTTQVRDVFEGALDEFILAYLKTEEAAKAWEVV